MATAAAAAESGLQTNKEVAEMSQKSVKRIAVGAVMGGVATLALATPANAVNLTPPNTGSGSPAPGAVVRPRAAAVQQPPSTGTAWQALPVATGALGGIALVGAGAAVFTGVRRRRGHLAHPA